jgi:NAD(P)-dependent dehydrogenase (short-subunit alcohol dehydrogenase family)
MNVRWFDDLNGKTAVVTGGAGVICGAMATCLARHGVKVAILDLKADSAEKKAGEIAAATGGSVIGVGGNVLDKNSLTDAKKRINDAMGPVDILINGAGGNSPKATTAQDMFQDQDVEHLESTFFGLDTEAFRSVFDLNFLGTLLPTMVFGRDMVTRKQGVVLNISSTNSFRPLTRIPAYSAAKASINNFTAWLAVHLAKQNVRVNAIAPGFLLTEQNRFLLVDQKTGSLTGRGEKIMAATPMGRFGAPDELLGAVLYLVSGMSQFVTGVVLAVDGGFNAYSGV